MKTCQYCHAEIQDDSEFCEYCGSPCAPAAVEEKPEEKEIIPVTETTEEMPERTLPEEEPAAEEAIAAAVEEPAVVEAVAAAMEPEEIPVEEPAEPEGEPAVEETVEAAVEEPAVEEAIDEAAEEMPAEEPAPAEEAPVEEAPAAEPEKKAEEPAKPAAPEKKKSSKVPVIVAAAAAVGAGALFGIPAYQKNNTYKEALTAMNEGNYAAAIETLESLEDYKDAPKYIEFCKGLQYLDNEDYDEALETISAVGELEGAEQYISYIEGMQYLEEGYSVENYTAAAEKFELAGEVRDSADMNIYTRAVAAFLADNNAEADTLFRELIERGTIDEWRMGRAQDAVLFFGALERFEAGDYDSLNVFKEVEKNGDTLFGKRASYYANYIDGLNHLNKGLFYSAYACFQKCGHILDSDDLAASCIQERPATGIVERNTQAGTVSVTITDTKDDDDMFIKIYDSNNALVETLYIRDGASATAYFGGGSYRMAIAWGDGSKWFGKEETFGSYGSYQRLLLTGSSEYFTFPAGNSYTLTFNSSNGNVGSKSSNYGDF
ncbi:MAG: zinc-ribbon domain-containing protein [Solobacterium sp.]|nr:zinc-ribbon domain-containing protein [Solobacterium sp.]